MKRNLICMIFVGFFSSGVLFADSSYTKRISYQDSIDITYYNTNAIWHYHNPRNYGQPSTNTLKFTLAIINEYESAQILQSSGNVIEIDDVTSQYDDVRRGRTDYRVYEKIRILRADGSEGEALSDGKFYGPGTIIVYYVFEQPSVATYVGNSNYNYNTYGWLRWNYGISVDRHYILRVSDTSPSPDSKFSVSLNNEGNRVALGIKVDGTNAIIRVYEFDGSDWQQLGSDID